MTVINRRQFGKSVAAGSVALFAASSPVWAAAQDATPAASPDIVELSPFGDTGLTEIVITASEYTFAASLPGAMAEGWYIMTLVNETEAVASANYAMLPEDTSPGELSTLVRSGLEGEAFPEWVGSTTFAGGNVAAPGESTTTLCYFTPGQWNIFSSNTASIQSPSSFSILTPEELEASYGVSQAEATPVADASPVVEAPAGVVATFTVEVTDAEIVQTDAPAAGSEQVIKVTNSGEQPHDLIILKTEDVLDPENAASLATSWIMGEETAAVPVGGVGMLSPGQTAFTSIMVEPGNYALFSALPDQNGGLQVDAGVVTVFTPQ